MVSKLAKTKKIDLMGAAGGVGEFAEFFVEFF